MDSFQSISITLPQEKMSDQIFYSTSKNWHRDHKTRFEFNKDDFLRELSCSTKNNQILSHFEMRAETVKLQHKLNEKNELLIKQSKWKNYYLKEQICVLVQEILQYLKFIGEEIEQTSYFHKYSKKLQRVIEKVQNKRKTEKNWIEFLGISSNQNLNTFIQQKAVQTSEAINQSLETENILQILSNDVTSLKEENKSLLKNLSIVTQEIQNKQKEIFMLKEKYLKLKSKRQKMKLEYNQLKFQFDEFVTKKQHRNQDLERTQNFSRRKQSKNATHFHTFSWDKNQISQKSKFAVQSQYNGYKIEEEGSNFFILSDTPLIQEKQRDLPISTGFIETRKKLILNQKQASKNQSKKSISNMKKKSLQKTISLMEKKPSQKSQISKKSKTQNDKMHDLEIGGQLPNDSMLYQNELDETDLYRQLLLSQAITIENLLDKI